MFNYIILNSIWLKNTRLCLAAHNIKSKIPIYSHSEKSWPVHTYRFPHTDGRAKLRQEWPCLGWAPGHFWYLLTMSEADHNDPADLSSWWHHTGTLYSAIHLYQALWEKKKSKRTWLIFLWFRASFKNNYKQRVAGHTKKTSHLIYLKISCR